MNGGYKAFHIYDNGHAGYLVIDHINNRISFYNDTTGNCDYLDFINRDYHEFKLVKESTGKIILSQRYKESLKTGNMWKSWVFGGGPLPTISTNNDYSSILPIITNLGVTSLSRINGIVLSNIPLTTSTPSSCSNYFFNPLGRSDDLPYSFTKDSTREINFTSPFWTHSGMLTSNLEILDSDGNEISWLNADILTGGITGIAPVIGVNHTFTIRITANTFTLDVPFFLNILNWKFDHCKTWKINECVEWELGYELDSKNKTWKSK